MKVLEIPQSGRDGAMVHCNRGGTQYVRRHVKPTDRKTAAQRGVRESMTAVAKGWAGWLSEAERQVWNVFAETIQSRVRLGKSGPLFGAVLFTKLNCPRELIGREWLRLPSEPVVFGPNPVGELSIGWEQGRLKLTLGVSGPVTDDIMVFATPPCRPAWRKCRKPRYIGLLPAPVNGASDITELYLDRFGEPPSGQRIFVRTIQQRDGWESASVDVSNLVPAKELPAQAAMLKMGLAEGEHRTLNREPPTSNRLGCAVRGSRLELQRSLFSVRWGCPISPCPREIHRVAAVGARWSPGRRRAVLGRVRRSGGRWGINGVSEKGQMRRCYRGLDG